MKRKIFVRGQKLEIAMEIGVFEKLGTWLRKTPPDTSSYIITHDEVNNVININVDGNVVLEDFDIESIEGIKGIYEVEFNIVNGQITKLYELSIAGLYSRIREYFISVLDNCLGKTTKEQEEYLFGSESGKIEPGAIEQSEELIRALPEFPTNEKLNDITYQILSGISGELGYALEAKDEFSVQMKQYAETLLKKINKNE